MTTVMQLLDDLAAGRMSLEQVADDFRSRTWPKPAGRASLAQAYGVHDDVPDSDPNSWKQVETDPRLTDEQYSALFAARRKS